MVDSTYIALERVRAQKKSPVVLWLVNIIWPGLGNLIVGQTGLGILFGLIHWAAIAFAVVTFGIGSIACAVNWVVASAVGHSRINRDYAASLAALEGGGAGQAHS